MGGTPVCTTRLQGGHEKMEVKGKPLRLRNVPVSLKVNSDRKATIANLSVNLGGIVFTATGSSWRDNGDSYDEYKGSVIAISRAVQELNDVMKNEVRKLDK
jgi:hypothetical protein